MKRILLLIILLAFTGNSWAQSGASSADALGKLLYTAIKTNNFNLIQSYCLTADQLQELRKQQQNASPNELDLYSAEEFNTYLKTNFETAIRERSSDTLTWKGVGLKTVKQNKEPVLNNTKQQVSMVLTDDRERDFQVQFDTLPINNSYYFLGNIKLVNE